jgi:hypothetical protein
MEAVASKVSCYSGHSYAQRPYRFTWQDEVCLISAIINEEHTPAGKRFLVKTPGGDLFYLDYDIEMDRWQASRAALPEDPRRNP